MSGLWWKALAFVLLLYVMLAGLLVPLKPGISSATPSVFTTGQRAELRVQGYNTNFDAAQVPRAWLRLGSPSTADRNTDTALLATMVKVISPQELAVTFALPRYLPTAAGSARASLLIDSPLDGAFVLPASISLTQPAQLAGPPDVGGWDDPIRELTPSTGTTYPYRGLLAESIRNQYFHVALWFALMLLMLAAAVYAGMYLKTGRPEHDRRSRALTEAGLLFGMLGLVTGMLWANYTWGKPWSGDVKQNMTAIALLIYLAYFVLRASLNSEQQAARVGAAYNVFSFAMLIPLLYVIPRMRDSLHPGNGGNPGFGGEDLDNTMRMVFYPAILGFTLLGLWLAQLRWRTARVSQQLLQRVLGD